MAPHFIIAQRPTDACFHHAHTHTHKHMSIQVHPIAFTHMYTPPPTTTPRYPHIQWIVSFRALYNTSRSAEWIVYYSALYNTSKSTQWIVSYSALYDTSRSTQWIVSYSALYNTCRSTQWIVSYSALYNTSRSLGPIFETLYLILSVLFFFNLKK